ncbi:MAG: alpha/beta hydrolase [Fuerstiella sp.]
MSGVFRYAKGIGSSLALAALAFGIQYGQSWLFRSVENPHPPGHHVVMDKFGRAGHSLSPQRRTAAPDKVHWKIAVVTNRLVATSSVVHQISSVSHESRTLAGQAMDLLYATPQTTFSFADVRVPVVRRRGQCECRDDPAKSVVVEQLVTQAESEFFGDLEQLIRQAQAKDVFIFVHGFNVSLEQAVTRAAQMSEDMPFHGITVAFSWQSMARTEAYLADEVLAERYFWNLAELLAQLNRRFGDSVRLHVLAHSMGNRVTLRALNALAGSIDPTGRETDEIGMARLLRTLSGDAEADSADHVLPERNRPIFSDGVQSVLSLNPAEIRQRFPDWGTWHADRTTRPQLQTLVLAAPDVDAHEFTGFVRDIRHVSRTMVLYASDTDVALQASRRVHGGTWRAGDSRARLDIEGLRTVRVSGVDTLDPLGHSYYGSHPTVLTQLSELLRPPIDSSAPISVLAQQGDSLGRN